MHLQMGNGQLCGTMHLQMGNGQMCGVELYLGRWRAERAGSLAAPDFLAAQPANLLLQGLVFFHAPTPCHYLFAALQGPTCTCPPVASVACLFPCSAYLLPE